MAFKYCPNCNGLVGYDPHPRLKQLQLRCERCRRVDATRDNIIYDITKSVSVAESMDNSSASHHVKLSEVQIRTIMNDPVLKRRRLKDACSNCGENVFILYQISTDKGLTEMNFIDICAHCGRVQNIKND